MSATPLRAVPTEPSTESVEEPGHTVEVSVGYRTVVFDTGVVHVEFPRFDMTLCGVPTEGRSNVLVVDRQETCVICDYVIQQAGRFIEEARNRQDAAREAVKIKTWGAALLLAAETVFPAPDPFDDDTSDEDLRQYFFTTVKKFADEAKSELVRRSQ